MTFVLIIYSEVENFFYAQFFTKKIRSFFARIRVTANNRWTHRTNPPTLRPLCNCDINMDAMYTRSLFTLINFLIYWFFIRLGIILTLTIITFMRFFFFFQFFRVITRILPILPRIWALKKVLLDMEKIKKTNTRQLNLNS